MYELVLYEDARGYNPFKSELLQPLNEKAQTDKRARTLLKQLVYRMNRLQADGTRCGEEGRTPLPNLTLPFLSRLIGGAAMETWSDALEEVTALSEAEKKQLEFIAQFVGSLVNRRKELGLSQRDLAEKSGIKQPVIARMESGAAIPRLETIFKLAYVMGLRDITIAFEEEASTEIAR